MSGAPTTPVQARRLAQECADTYRRALNGGLFYLVAWLIVGYWGGVGARSPMLYAGVALLLAGIGGLRFVHKPPLDAGPERQFAWLLRHWGLVFATSASWSAVFVWSVVDPAFAPGRTAALLSTLAFATAFAHTFSMRAGLAIGGMAVLYLPGLVLLWMDPAQRAESSVMTVYLAYVLFAMIHAHRSYQERLDLDQDLRDQRDLFARQSRSDALTGLANRRRFVDVVGAAIESRTPLALMILDLDHFKQVNDAHGHAVGDACLVAFADRLRAAFGLPGALPARLGGEEFAVVLEGPVAAQAVERAEQFRLALAATPIRADGLTMPVPVTVSIGVSEFDPVAHVHLDGLYRAADRAVYRAKHAGRNRVDVEERRTLGQTTRV